MLITGLIIATSTQIYDIRCFGQVEYFCSNPVMVSRDYFTGNQRFEDMAITANQFNNFPM
jgi:hypothetical protein